MFCHKCGNKSPDEARFCHKCGAKVIVETSEASSDSPEQQTELLESQYEYIHAQQEDIEYSPTNQVPENGQSVEPAEDYTEYMDYMYFPAQQATGDPSVKEKGDKIDMSFIDYPIQPNRPKPVVPKPKVVDYPILKDSPAPKIKPVPLKQPQSVAPKRTVNQRQTDGPRMDFSQTSSDKPVAKPPEPKKIIVPKPEPLNASFVDLDRTLPPINQKSDKQQIIENSSFVDFPSASTEAIRPDPIIPQLQYVDDSSFANFSAASAVPPKPVEIRGQFNFSPPPVAPRQINTDLLFMDDTNFANKTPPQTEIIEPELFFNPRLQSPHAPGPSMPQPMQPMINHDFQSVNMPGLANDAPDFNGFTRNPVYEPNDMVTHMPKKGKGAIIFTAITGVVFIATLVIFLVFIRGGSVSPENMVGTWTPAGYVLGPHNLRMQFNEDGSGRQYRFHTSYHTEENIITFEWRIEGRNQLILINTMPGYNLLWPHESVIEISTRTGEPSLRFRPEGQSEWGEEYRQVRVLE